MIKTYSARPSEISHQWYLVDASGQTLGRLATLIATYLQGKHKPTYTAHLDSGDNIVVINAAQIRVTGNKLRDKKYYHHSGYPGGIKAVSLAQALAKDPAGVTCQAVKGMLPKNRLSAQMLAHLRVYPDAQHPHAPQQPQILGVPHDRD